MLPVSLSFAAALALLSLWHAYRVSRVRLPAKVMIGSGDNPQLESRSRAHANFAEYSPFVLGLVVLIELAGASRTWLWGVTTAYLLARIAHAFGMDRRTPNPLRAGGILVTWLVLLGLALWALSIASHTPTGVPETRLL